jgi:hypothetical protein
VPMRGAADSDVAPGASAPVEAAVVKSGGASTSSGGKDWAAHVKKYAADADDDAIAGIIRYLGIALRNRDSSLVAFSDKDEVARVRTNFLQKKLELPHPEAELDVAIASIGERMKGDRSKNRVTVYYLLADRFNKLGMFR